MMKCVFAMVFLLLTNATSWSFDFSPYENSGPTLSAEINYFILRYGADDRMLGFANWQSDPVHRRRLLQQTWGMATRQSVDNRSYLFALAIDLYNMMPPDVRPELAPCQPTETNDCDVYEPALEPLKMQAWADMTNGYLVDEEKAKRNWEFANTPEVKEIAFLSFYAKQHLRLDAPDAAASLDPRRLNLHNPTHYAELARWMAETVTARAQGVPPWEAMKRFPEYGRGVTSPATTATPAAQPGVEPAPAQLEPSPAEPTDPIPPAVAPPDKPTPRGALAMAVVAILLLAAAAAWLLRRRRPQGGDIGE